MHIITVWLSFVARVAVAAAFVGRIVVVFVLFHFFAFLFVAAVVVALVFIMIVNMCGGISLSLSLCIRNIYNFFLCVPCRSFPFNALLFSYIVICV